MIKPKGMASAVPFFYLFAFLLTTAFTGIHSGNTVYAVVYILFELSALKKETVLLSINVIRGTQHFSKNSFRLTSTLGHASFTDS